MCVGAVFLGTSIALACAPCTPFLKNLGPLPRAIYNTLRLFYVSTGCPGADLRGIYTSSCDRSFRRDFCRTVWRAQIAPPVILACAPWTSVIIHVLFTTLRRPHVTLKFVPVASRLRAVHLGPIRVLFT